MKTFVLSGLMLLLAGGVFAFPQDAPATKAYGLDELIQLMKQNNLLIKRSGLDLDIARQDYRVERTLPDLELEASRGNAELLEQPAPDAKVWGVGLSWRIPNPFYRYYHLRSLRANVRQAGIMKEMNLRLYEKTLKHHFFRLQLFKKRHEFLREKIRILTEMNRITRARVSIGEAKEIDALRTSVEIQKSRTQLFGVEQSISYERAKVNEFMNNTLGEDFTIVEDFNFLPLRELDELGERMLANSLAMKLKLEESAHAKDHLASSRWSFLEGVDVFAERERELEADIWRFGVGVSVPLFGSTFASAKRARLEVERAAVDLEHEKKHLAADIKRLTSQLNILQREIDTFRGAILKEGEENMKLTGMLYRSGEVSLTVYLDAQESYYELQDRYYEAITEWKLLKAEIEEILGEER